MSLRNTENLFTVCNNITSPNHQDAIQTKQLANFLLEEEKVLKYNPYILNDTQRSYLAAMGMQSAPSAAELHDHPIHKVMESYIWLEKLARQLTKKTTVAFTKHGKFLELQEKNRNVVTLVNPCVTEKDQIRYKPETTDLIITCKTPYLVLHDAGHFYTPEMIAAIYRKNPKLEIIFLTLVIPVESTICADSFYPELYELRYARDTLIYIPEGHDAGAYEQPISGHWWLNTNCIQDRELSLGVKRLESFKAHHLFMTTRTKGIFTDKYATYSTPDLTILPAIFPNAPIRQRLVPLKMMTKLHDYAKAVKTNSVLNLEAKLRHLLVDHGRTTEDTLFLLVHFIYTTINMRRGFVMEDCLEVDSPFYRFLLRCKETFLANPEKEKLERYLAAVRIQKFHFTFTLNTVFGSTVNQNFTLSPQPDNPHHFTITSEQPKTEAETSNNPVAEEEEEEENFVDAIEEAPEQISSTRIGNDCGLRALAKASNLTYSQVNVAYQETKRQLRPQILEAPGFDNFKANVGFPWLTGQELVYISATMNRVLAIHTDTFCRVPEHPDIHVRNENNCHWEAHFQNDHCSCHSEVKPN